MLSFEEQMTRDAVAYHNPDTMGYSALQVREPVVMTNKHVPHDAVGTRVWLLTGEGQPRRFYLRASFTIFRVELGTGEGFQTRVSGSEERFFSPMIDLTDAEWFDEFRRSQGNFAFGYQTIQDSRFVMGLEAAASSRRSYRTDPERARQHITKQWLDTACLRTCAQLIARSVQHAHARAPASWSLSLFEHFIRLNVGQIAVLELFATDLVLYSVAGPPVTSPEFEQIEHRYRAVPVDTERWTVALDALREVPGSLVARHFDLIAVAARAKRTSPFKRSHAPGAVAALATLAGCQLPQPAYETSQIGASQIEEAIEQAGAADSRRSLFGDPRQNAEVERAAIAIVTTRLRTDGWEVTSVEREGCGYDLLCRRGDRECHVEVKGTRHAPDQFVMTAGEVRRSRTDAQFRLFVVGHAIGPEPSVEEWTGRSFEESFRLAPLQYVARRNTT